MSSDAIIGFIFGLFSSLISGIILFWLQGRRDIKQETLRQRRDDIRVARNWLKDGKNISMRGFDLAGANLSGKNLSHADLEDANLEGARMWSTDFSGANLIHANFHNAEMKNVKFNGAKLLSSDFSGAKLVEVNFTAAKLHRAHFRRVKQIKDCTWADAFIDETTDMSEKLLQEIQEQNEPKKENVKP